MFSCSHKIFPFSFSVILCGQVVISLYLFLTLNGYFTYDGPLGCSSLSFRFLCKLNKSILVLVVVLLLYDNLLFPVLSWSVSISSVSMLVLPVAVCSPHTSFTFWYVFVPSFSLNWVIYLQYIDHVLCHMHLLFLSMAVYISEPFESITSSLLIDPSTQNSLVA